MRTVILIVIGLFLTGCTSLVTTDQPRQTGFVALTPDVQLGQTFVARYDGLRAVHLYLSRQTEVDGDLRLMLTESFVAAEMLGISISPAELITSPNYYRFDFSPQKDSSQVYYALTLELTGDGLLDVGNAEGISYLDGAMYQDGIPAEAQMTIKLEYDPVMALLGLVKEFIGWLAVLGIGGLVYILPGWAILSWAWRGWNDCNWLEKLCLGCGASLVIYPLLLLWGDVMQVHPGRATVWIPVIAGILVVIARNWRKLNREAGQVWLREARSRTWLNLCLFLLIGLVVISRFYATRTLEMPLWGDSYQHTLIARLLVENKGLFESWKPYADLYTFTYHFGWHANVAAFHWLRDGILDQELIHVGQIFNIMAVLCIYPLAKRFSKHELAGIGAVLLAGLMLHLPMTYTNWGRYTQLTGQIILLVVSVLLWEYLDGKNKSRGLLVCLWLLLGGLALTHYRVLVYALFFLLTCFAFTASRKSLLPALKSILFIGLGAFFVFAPWFLRIYSGEIAGLFGRYITTPAQDTPSFTQEYNAIGGLTNYLPAWVWVSMAAIVLWGIIKRKRGMLMIALWWVLLLLAANPGWIRLPGAGILSNFAIFIAMYIPAGLILGSGLGWITDWIRIRPARLRVFLQAGLVIALSIAGLIGFSERIADIKPEGYTLVTRPDKIAANWIGTSLPEEATLLVNSFFAYGDSLIVGSDAGWWMPYLGYRQTTLPPLTYGVEEGPFPGYIAWVNALTQTIIDEGITSEETIAMLKERKVSHVYIGQRRGGVNYSGPARLDPLELALDPHFQVIYRKDLVWIFQFIAEP